jgi:Fe-S-cluster containining protein
MEGDECLCERCAKLGKTCCQQAEIYVTLMDVQRIFEKTGQNNFYEFAKCFNPEYADQDDDPVWSAHVFRPDGTRRILRKDSFGNCIFLGQKGCILPLESRPLVCRLYPYTYSASGIYKELETGCPVHLLEPGQKLEQFIDGCCVENACHWHQMLYTEILREEEPNYDHRADLRSAV